MLKKCQGGNTIFGTTCIFGNNSDVMFEQEIATSDEDFYNWFMSPDSTCIPESLQVMVEQTGGAISENVVFGKIAAQNAVEYIK